MAYYEFEGKRPSVAAGSYVHPLAAIIGDVTIGANCYIGPGACLRADFGKIVIGDGSNVQECCVIHSAVGAIVKIGQDCHIGHGAILHGSTLRHRVTVGMGAIIMDEAVIDDDCMVAAGSVVTSRTIVPAGKMVMGTPAKIVGDVQQHRLDLNRDGTRLYQTLPERYGSTLRELSRADVEK